MLYHPFERLEFDTTTCLLTGSRAAVEQVTAFPRWILERFALAEKPFKLLDESIVAYGDIRVPASAPVREAFAALDQEVLDAFSEGYAAVIRLPEVKLFQWIGKLMYGVLHHEIRIGMRQQAMAGERMTFSHALVHRFGYFHTMLQSIVTPMTFEGVQPWSISISRVDNPAATFSYRDEINTLTFSLRTNDFGIVACLQDNGENKAFHREVLALCDDHVLQPIQFEELCACFFYSSYLFNRLPDYTLIDTPGEVFIEPMPFTGAGKPLFDHWQNKVYGQVLENFWKPWGLLLLEIIKDPENPVTFLRNLDGSFREDVGTQRS